MKMNKVNILSKTTNSMMILILIVSILFISNISFANALVDENGGPGIGMSDSTWNGATNNTIYGYGNLNGINGDDIVMGKAYSTLGPTEYVVNDDSNPINHYLIDMGPQTANNDAYALHFINDGGPGMEAFSNALGTTQVYNDGGPGFAGNTDTSAKIIYPDSGPTTIDQTVNPSDYMNIMNITPNNVIFSGGTADDKLKNVK